MGGGGGGGGGNRVKCPCMPDVYFHLINQTEKADTRQQVALMIDGVLNIFLPSSPGYKQGSFLPVTVWLHYNMGGHWTGLLDYHKHF